MMYILEIILILKTVLLKAEIQSVQIPDMCENGVKVVVEKKMKKICLIKKPEKVLIESCRREGTEYADHAKMCAYVKSQKREN